MSLSRVPAALRRMTVAQTRRNAGRGGYNRRHNQRKLHKATPSQPWRPLPLSPRKEKRTAISSGFSAPPTPPYPKEYVATQELDRVADDLTAPRADCAHGQRQPCSKERRLGRGMWNYFSLRWQGLQRTSQARWAQTGHKPASRPLEYLEAPVCTALVPHPVRALHFQTATLLPF